MMPIAPTPEALAVKKAFKIVPETSEYRASITRLVAQSFGGEERKKRTVHQFRDGIDPLWHLGFIAINEAKEKVQPPLVGSIRFWPVELYNKATNAVFTIPMLGPLALFPEYHGQGTGRGLVAQGLEAAQNAGYPGVLIVGHPGYYIPQGFSVSLCEGLEMPGPVAPLTLMGIEFEQGFLNNKSGNIRPLNLNAQP